MLRRIIKSVAIGALQHNEVARRSGLVCRLLGGHSWGLEEPPKDWPKDKPYPARTVCEDCRVPPNANNVLPTGKKQ